MTIEIVIPKPDLEWNPFNEIDFKSEFRGKGGVYFFYNESKELMYVGKAKNILTRISQHRNSSEDNSTARSSATHYVKHNFQFYSFFVCDDELEREIYETYAINTMRPKLNRAKVITYESEHYSDKYRKKSREDIEREAHRERRAESLRGFCL